MLGPPLDDPLGAVGVSEPLAVAIGDLPGGDPAREDVVDLPADRLGAQVSEVNASNDLLEVGDDCVGNCVSGGVVAVEKSQRPASAGDLSLEEQSIEGVKSSGESGAIPEQDQSWPGVGLDVGQERVEPRPLQLGPADRLVREGLEDLESIAVGVAADRVELLFDASVLLRATAAGIGNRAAR